MPGAWNALSARLVEEAGFPAVYMTGSGVANTLLGKPDVGLLTMGEMTMMAHYLAEAVSVPVISDADTGYGNAINVMRTVREFEAAGVAAIHLEDQVNPKRCGHIQGKELVPCEEMEGKLRAAADARRDDGLVIIARTDARGPAGLDAAIERANRYREAGADMAFPDALLSEEEFETFARSVPGPKMMNMGGYAARRTTPKMPLEFLARIGFNVAIFPLAMLRAGARAERDFLEGLRARGTAFELRAHRDPEGPSDGELVRVHRDRGIRELETRYLPGDHMGRKYEGEGYRPGTGPSAPGTRTGKWGPEISDSARPKEISGPHFLRMRSPPAPRSPRRGAPCS